MLDTEKRLNVLFDHLNNEDLLKPDTISEMNELAQALQGRQYEQAHAVITDIMANKSDEGMNWMVRTPIRSYLIEAHFDKGRRKETDCDESGNPPIDEHFKFYVHKPSHYVQGKIC